MPCYFIGFQTGPIYTYHANDSVYWYDEAGEVFRLLIAFDAQAGESWIVPVSDPDSPGEILDTVVYYVDSVSQIVIDGIPLQQLYVTRSSPDLIFGLAIWSSGPITERLGDLHYMMPWVVAGCSDGYGVDALVCYEDPEIAWLNPEYPQCDLGIGMEGSSASSSLLIVPNPVAAGDIFQFNNSGMKGAHFSILDLAGRELIHAADLDGSFHINVPGTYLVSIRSDDGFIVTSRLIVQ